MTTISDNFGNTVVVNVFALATGEKAGFYTLRAYGDRLSYRKSECGRVETTYTPASVYLGNLSTDKEVALQKARALVAQNYPGARFSEVVRFDLDDIHRMSREESERRAAAEAERIATTDFSIFQSGKYAGCTVLEVIEQDARYADWYADNAWSADSDNARTAAIIRTHLQPARQVAADAHNARLQALKSEIGADTLAAWYEGEGGAFLRSIANDLKQGVIPRGRGLAILLEILAKWAGKKGSKAFNARLTELEAKFAA